MGIRFNSSSVQKSKQQNQIKTPNTPKTLKMYSLTSLHQARNFSATSLLRFYGRPHSANFPGCLESEKCGGSENSMLRILGNLGMSLFSTSAKGSASAPYALGFQKYVHSTSQKDFENGRNSRPMNFVRGVIEEDGRNSRPMNFVRGVIEEDGRNSRPMNFLRGVIEGDGRNSRPMDFLRGVIEEDGRNSRPMDFVRGVREEDGRGFRRWSEYPRYNVEQNADFVHIKLLRNNTFVTVTDSKGNKKIGASWGCLPELKGGPKMSRYAADATAEHVGRLARNMGLKSVVMRVNGFTYFKKKRQAIMSFREGFSNSRNQNPIVYIEDTTRKPHNGCRLRKKRRY